MPFARCEDDEQGGDGGQLLAMCELRRGVERGTAQRNPLTHRAEYRRSGSRALELRVLDQLLQVFQLRWVDFLIIQDVQHQ